MVNRALPSLHGESLEITLAAPLKLLKIVFLPLRFKPIKICFAMHLGLNHLINYFNSLIKNASLIEYLSGLGLSEVLHIFSLFPSIQDNSLNLIIHAKYRVNQKE